MSEYPAEPSRTVYQRGEFVLRHGRRRDDGRAVLLVSAGTEHTAPASLKKLEHELSLASLLDPQWALRPLTLLHDEGRAVLVLDDPEGEPLDQLIAHPMEPALFLPLAIRITEALVQVHACGLVHKDIKPAHLFVARHGPVRFTGFGIATRLPREWRPCAAPEVLSGTLAYMAPEQTGRMNRSIDSRSDLYSLGVTFYRMLTGKLPFSATDPLEWVHCHIARAPVPPAEWAGLPTPLPGALSALVMKLLAKIPEARYQTAAGLLEDLRHCERQFTSTGRIEPFPLGENDTPQRLLIPEVLYGREPEVRALLASLDRVLTQGGRAMALVSGYAGIGKSSVVNELHRALVAPRALFASGKFDQYKRDIPYATLAQAFRGLAQQLLAKDEADVARWRDALRAALGPHGQMIVNLVPEIELILGKQAPLADLSPLETPNLFRMVLLRFIGVFARPEHPLVLFLDDLQWLDAATLNLIRSLMTDSDIGHLLLVGAYRDNEVDAAHPLMRTIDAIRQSGAQVDDILLAPLQPADVAAMVADALHCGVAQAQPLARLVHDKTGGNPFFAIQFLRMLEDESLMAFDASARAWHWDLPRIRAKDLTHNVVDLLLGQVARLPEPALAVLKRLACLGNEAELSTLAMLAGQSEEAVQADLLEAEIAGLVIDLGGTVRFQHDRVQEAIYSLIAHEQRGSEHLRIGRWLHERTAPEDIEAKVFEIVNQLNRGLQLITDATERRQVAELNLRAGARARRSTAHAAALGYLTTGMTLLPENPWESAYALVFALEFRRSECEFLTGALPLAEERLDRLVGLARGIDDLAAVAVLRLALYQATDRNSRAVEVCLSFLRGLGLAWHEHPSTDELQREYRRLWQRLPGLQIEALAQLPAVADPEVRATVDVLAAALAPFLLTDTNLYRLALCRITNLSLEHGNCDGSCVGYVHINMILREELGDHEAGRRFGMLALALVDRGLARFRGRIHGSFAVACSPWSDHFRVGIPYRERAVAMGRESGDLVFELYARLLLIPYRLLLEDPLDGVQSSAEDLLALATRLRFNQVIASVKAQLGFIRALRGLTSALDGFDSEHIEQGPFEQELESDARLRSPACWYWVRQLQARFLAQDAAGALAAARKAQQHFFTSLTPFEEVELHYYAALARAAHCSALPAEALAAEREALQTHAAWLDVFADRNPASGSNRAKLVNAEIARLDGRDMDALRLYEQAIRSAREQGFVQNEAVALELAARFHAALGLDTNARSLLQAARRGYQRWGALGKVRELESRHPFLRLQADGDAMDATISTPAAQLDAAAALKAAQAVSGEIELDSLVRTLLVTAMESAGADRALLLLLRHGKAQVEAEARTGPGGVTVLPRAGQPEREADPDQWPQSILQYVMRSRTPVVLEDAASGSMFSTDACVRQRQPRSVLCLPLLEQARLVGVLYMENSLVPHAFTAARMALLDVLAAQAAISLENAGLYADLRQREARIRQLVDSSLIGIVFWTTRGITDANDAFLAIIGYSRQDLAAGRVQWARITPPEYQSLEEQVLERLQASGRSTTYERDFIRQDGTRVPALLGGVLLEGTRDQGVSFVLDLSERKQAEAERAARQLAEAANKAKTAFLATMSHELRTPLNGILGFAQLLQCDPTLTERQARGLKVIDDSGQHLLTLINDILDLARIDSTKLDLYAAPVQLPKFLALVCDIVRVKAEEKGVLFEHEAAADLPASVVVDEKRLRQVLLNLLSNAVKFTDAGAVQLRVTASAGTSAGTARLRFLVEDGGIGMTDAQVARLFTPFEQVGEARRREGGTGLGLAISQQLVRLMGGDITVHSRPGAGSTFSFEIEVPLSPAAGDARLGEAAPVGYAGRRRRVLVVDDTPSGRAVLVDALSALGFEVHDAADGAQALEEAARMRPDLVITDLVMPEMDGFELTRRLRSAPAGVHLPIIATSASATPDTEAQSRAAGANLFIGKPIERPALFGAIGSLLGLDWIHAAPPATTPAPAPADEAPGHLVAPPPDELELLRQLARIGNMRSIAERADHVRALDPRYAPFAARLQALAAGYQSKAILDLVEEAGRQGGDPQALGSPSPA